MLLSRPEQRERNTENLLYLLVLQARRKRPEWDGLVTFYGPALFSDEEVNWV